MDYAAYLVSYQKAHGMASVEKVEAWAKSKRG
jgi:hypothetical protein